MKYALLALMLTSLLSTTFAANTDSLVYQLQRQKINGLLNARSNKFNQYAESLDKHTGIFGLQTKKDIKRSNEILMDIVHTDNTIFKELKILLDYKTFQQTQVASKSTESEGLINNYMLAINKLRQQNEKLKAEDALTIQKYHDTQVWYVVAIIILIITSIFVFYNRSLVKRA